MIQDAKKCESSLKYDYRDNLPFKSFWISSIVILITIEFTFQIKREKLNN